MRSRNAPRITIRDVAQRAGVSIGTASRALNRTGRVSDKSIEALASIEEGKKLIHPRSPS